MIFCYGSPYGLRRSPTIGRLAVRAFLAKGPAGQRPWGGLELGEEKLGDQARSESARFWSHEGFVGPSRRFGFCSKYNDGHCDSRMPGTLEPFLQPRLTASSQPLLHSVVSRKVSSHLWASVSLLQNRDGEFQRSILVLRLCRLKFGGSRVERLRAWALG